MKIIRADELARNSRVILNIEDTPHLVDWVRERPSGTLSVVFSSGEHRTYDPDSPVVVPNDAWEGVSV